MAVADDVRLVANDARCYEKCIPPGMQDSVMIFLLAEILQNLNPGSDVSASTLLEGARCYEKCIPPGSQMSTIIHLLYEIAYSGGGVGAVRHGSGVPVGVNPGTPTTQYTDDSTGIQYTYTSGVWI